MFFNVVFTRPICARRRPISCETGTSTSVVCKEQFSKNSQVGTECLHIVSAALAFANVNRLVLMQRLGEIVYREVRREGAGIGAMLRPVQ